jgi:very-short-patch-repair endonuclease
VDQKSASIDCVIANLAARQHGVAATAQLLAAGLTSTAIYKRLRAGRLHRVHQGVLAVGHRGLSPEGRWMAAVLACGRGSALSHWSAASLFGLLKIEYSNFNFPLTHVTVRGTGRRRRPGIRIHRSRSLTPREITRRKGIPVTTPARTIADLRRVAPANQVRRAIRNAEALGLPLGDAVEPDRTRSELERLFLALCRRYHLPAPQLNIEIGKFVVDFVWPDQRVIAETDGYKFHRGRQAFEDDRARDVELSARGFLVLRFTYAQVQDDPAAVAASLRAVLLRREEQAAGA